MQAANKQWQFQIICSDTYVATNLSFVQNSLNVSIIIDCEALKFVVCKIIFIFIFIFISILYLLLLLLLFYHLYLYL